MLWWLWWWETELTKKAFLESCARRHPFNSFQFYEIWNAIWNMLRRRIVIKEEEKGKIKRMRSRSRDVFGWRVLVRAFLAGRFDENQIILYVKCQARTLHMMQGEEENMSSLTNILELIHSNMKYVWKILVILFWSRIN